MVAAAADLNKIITHSHTHTLSFCLTGLHVYLLIQDYPGSLKRTFCDSCSRFFTVQMLFQSW